MRMEKDGHKHRRALTTSTQWAILVSIQALFADFFVSICSLKFEIFDSRFSFLDSQRSCVPERLSNTSLMLFL